MKSHALIPALMVVLDGMEVELDDPGPLVSLRDVLRRAIEWEMVSPDWVRTVRADLDTLRAQKPGFALSVVGRAAPTRLADDAQAIAWAEARVADLESLAAELSPAFGRAPPTPPP